MPIIMDESNFNGYIQSIPYHHGYTGVKNKEGIYIAANTNVAQLTGFNTFDGLLGRSDYELRCPAAENAEIFRMADIQIFESKTDADSLSFDRYTSQWEIMLATRTIICSAQLEPIALSICATSITHYSLMKLGFMFNNMLHEHIKKHKSFFITLAKKYTSGNLTERQSQVLFYLIRGYSAKESAKALQISPKTVERHIEDIKIKLDCRSKSQLIDKAVHEGLIDTFIENNI